MTTDTKTTPTPITMTYRNYRGEVSQAPQSEPDGWAIINNGRVMGYTSVKPEGADDSWYDYKPFWFASPQPTDNTALVEENIRLREGEARLSLLLNERASEDAATIERLTDQRNEAALLLQLHMIRAEKAEAKLAEVTAELRVYMDAAEAHMVEHMRTIDRAEKAEATNERLVEAANQSRLAFAGYVSPQSAIDKLDAALAQKGGSDGPEQTTP